MAVIIIGAGGFAREVYDFLAQEGKKVKGFISNEQGYIHGIPILGGDELLEKLIKEDSELEAVVALGKPQLRKKLFEYVEKLGYNLPNVIHKSKCISPYATVGKGCIIYPGVVINTDVQIGNGVLLNSNSSIGHDTIIENYVNINPNVAVGGKVVLGECAYIGIGASIFEKIIIGKNTIVGGGGVVRKNLPDNVTAVGVPTKIIKK